VRPQAFELGFLRHRVFGRAIFGSIVFAPSVDRHLLGSLVVGDLILGGAISSIILCSFFVDSDGVYRGRFRRLQLPYDRFD
jgi:hypothetical protein